MNFRLIDERDYLMHYGVKGMRWGVRHDRERSGIRKTASSIKSGLRKRKAKSIERKRNKALSVTSSARYTYKQRQHLSDAELQARIRRLDMEKHLKDLSNTRHFQFVTLPTGEKAARKALGYYGAKVVLDTYVPGASQYVKVPKK